MLCFTLLLFLPGLVLAQDPDPDPDSLNLTGGNFLGLLEAAVVFLVGIATGRWRQTLTIVSAIIPHLRALVDVWDKDAVQNIQTKRQLYSARVSKPMDTELRTIRRESLYSLLILFTLIPLTASSQDTISMTPPAFYAATDPAGLELSYLNFDREIVDIENGDTLYYPRTQDYIDSPLFKQAPFFFTGSDVDQWRLYDQKKAVIEYHYRESFEGVLGTTTESSNYFRENLNGIYWAVLEVDSISRGRVIHFYITGDSYDPAKDTIKPPVIVPPDTTSLDTDSLLSRISTLEAQIEALSISLEEIRLTAVKANNNSLRARQASEENNALLKGAIESTDSLIGVIVEQIGASPQEISRYDKEDIIIEQLTILTIDELRAKFYKTREILVQGIPLSTNDFAEFAGVSRLSSETNIFTAGKEKIGVAIE